MVFQLIKPTALAMAPTAARRLISGLVCTLALSPSAAGATEIYADGEIILELAPGHTVEEINATWGTVTRDTFPEGDLHLVFKENAGDLEAFAEMMENTDARILETEANYLEDTPEGTQQMVFIAVGGTVVDFEDQFLTQRIGVDEAHTYATGAGVTVAIIDTGVDPNHEIFAGRLSAAGWDFLDGDAEPWEIVANGVDDDGDQAIDESFGHGTMVASMVALVAPDATLLPIRALDDDGRGSTWDLVRATRYALNQGAQVINMSFGVPRHISMLGHQLEYAALQNVTIVAGAGNENRSSPSYYPADDSKAFMITALDSLDVKADFADYNSKVVVSAPGTGVRAAFPGGGWALGSGCSFAAPIVTGEVALILGLLPGLSPAAVESRVEAAVQPVDHLPGNGPYSGDLGSGRVFLPFAVEEIVAVAEPTYQAPAPTGLQLAPNPTDGALTLSLEWMPRGTRALVRVFDVHGRQRHTFEARGATSVGWNGEDATGRRLSPGVYYVRVEGSGFSRTAPVQLLH